eukprot:g4175.t1
MTEYWKSTPTHYCEVCRIWIKDIQNNVANHERSERHKERLAQKIAGQRREAEKEATKTAKVLMTVHDIESKALASFAADLREIEKSESLMKPAEQQKPQHPLSTDSQTRKIKVEVPKHPHQSIGGYKIPDIRKLGVQKGGITKKRTTPSTRPRVKVNAKEEEKALKLRREAQERVRKREEKNFGLKKL